MDPHVLDKSRIVVYWWPLTMMVGAGQGLALRGDRRERLAILQFWRVRVGRDREAFIKNCPLELHPLDISLGLHNLKL